MKSQGDPKALCRVILRDRKRASGSDWGLVAVWSADKENNFKGLSDHNWDEVCVPVSVCVCCGVCVCVYHYAKVEL